MCQMEISRVLISFWQKRETLVVCLYVSRIKFSLKFWSFCYIYFLYYFFVLFMTFVHLLSKLFKAAKCYLESMSFSFGEKETYIHAENTVLKGPDEEGSQKDSLPSQTSYIRALKCRYSDHLLTKKINKTNFRSYCWRKYRNQLHDSCFRFCRAKEGWMSKCLTQNKEKGYFFISNTKVKWLWLQ